MNAKRSNATVFGFFVALIVGLLLSRDVVTGSVQTAALLASVTGILSVAAIGRSGGSRPLTAGTIYAALSVLFHTGLLWPMSLGAQPKLFNVADIHWVSSPSFATACHAVAVGQCAFTLAYLSRRLVVDARPSRQPTGARARTQAWDAGAIVGLTLILCGVGLWYLNTRASGIAILGSSYEIFLAQTRGTSMPAAYLLVGLGMPVLAAGRSTRVRRSGLVAFSVWAFVALALGLRGEVIFPAAAYLVVLARRRSLRPRPWMAMAAVAGLALGAGVRVIRQSGLGGGAATLRAFNPLDAVAELGYSIRPMVVVTELEGFGDASVGVGTYLAPFKRAIGGIIPGLDVVDVGDDPVVFTTMIAARAGQIGGSTMAEAYRSAGILGVIVVMAIVGLVLANLDRQAAAPIRDTMVGLFSFIFFLWIRNDFTPVPAQAALALLVLSVLKLADYLTAHREPPRPRRQSAVRPSGAAS